METSPAEFMSPEDLAEYLGIPVATIYQWRHKGYGPPAVKIGRHLRYRRIGVDAWIAQQEGTSAA